MAGGELIDLSEDPLPFDPKLFTGLRKKFPSGDANDLQAQGARDALRQVLAVPSDIKYIPRPDLPILDFVALELPNQSHSLVLTKPRSWYSDDIPVTDVGCLLSRPIPPKDFLLRLEEEAGQAWFDGCKSILDPRYNDGSDRFPLWVLMFWKEMAQLADARWKWETSVGWVDGQLQKELPNQDLEALAVTKELFATMGWNTKIWGQWTHLDLAKILSWQWLADDHIDMLMADLSARVEADPELAKSVLVAPLAFSDALKRAGDSNYTKEDAPLLARYEAHIKKHGLKRLYFPNHVNGNHWISGRIDFERKLFGTGDSRVGVGKTAPPTHLIKSTKRWLKSKFAADFTYEGDSMDHGEQRDTTSCGIVAPNTIAVDIFSDEIWEQEHAAGARANCFIRLTHSPAIRKRFNIPPKPDVQPEVPEDAPAEVSVAVALGDHNFPDLAEFVADVRVRQSGPSLMELLNPVAERPPTPEEDSEMPDVAPEADGFQTDAVETYTGDHGDVEIEDDEMDVDEPVPDNEVVAGIEKKAGGDAASVSSARAKSRKTLAGFFGFKEKLRNTTETATTKKRSRQDIDESVDIDPAQPEKRARTSNVTGTCKSSLASKSNLDAYKSGALNPTTADPAKLARWKKKLEADDPKVEYHPTDLLKAKHSVCGEYVTMGLPYKASKWNTHLSKICPVLHPEKRKNKGKGRQGLASVPSLLSWGLTAADSAYLPGYLQRTGAVGGGGRSLTAIAKEKFGKMFAKLGRKNKQIVSDVQFHEHRWRNDHSNLRVFSTRECSSLLGLKNFKQAIRRPAPDDKDYIYVNDKYRNQLLGHLYARSIGLKEIIETADAKNTPCIKFVQGTLQGKYTEFEVFGGLVEAMVMKTDKLERGVGMQNFKYPPAWDELCHIVQIHSPTTARALAEHFPVRTARNFRQVIAKEAKKPRFPMEIGERTFQLVQEYLAALDYHGPVNLSCDDTKLFPSLRMYHDAKEKADYLVGAVEGPIRVADPEAMKKVLEDATVVKATKVRVWCLSVPLPAITPLVIAAMPIPNDIKAEELLVPLEKILNGLLTRKIRVVSYACDGTEVERPIPDAPDLALVIGVFHGFPIVMIQDSKHALKTFRNNLFTGARLLTFGNFTAVFRRIYQMAMAPDSPYDPAALRLFCAETLAYLSENFPEYIGEIVYLLSSESSWTLIKTGKYLMWKESRWFCGHAISSMLDIAGILIKGIISLIIVHRDHIPDNFPLLPWFHSSEPCEHTFGDTRKIVKDFTLLDFIYVIPKLRITMRRAVLAAKSSDPKACAQGYSHTYYDNTGANLLALAVYPSDADISAAAEAASAETDALVSLLGLVPDQLHRKQSAPLPSIGAWFSEDDDEVDQDEEFDDIVENKPSDAEELQALIDEQEGVNAPLHGARVGQEVMSLTCASIALSADEHMRVQQFQQMDEEESDGVLGEEYLTIQETITGIAATPDALALPPVQLPDEASKPFGHSLYTSANTIDFSPLVTQRLQHQTKQAEKCTRTKTMRSMPKAEESMRRQILRRFHEILKESDQARALGTSVERKARWNMGSTGSTGSGNAANAAAAASAVATKAATRRAKLFKDAKVPLLHLVTAGGVTPLKKLAVGDFGIVWTENGLRVAQVQAMYSKGGGKHGKHNNIGDHANLSGISNLGMQVYEPFQGCHFRAITEATATPKTTPTGIELTASDFTIFRDLSRNIKLFDAAVKQSKSRKQKGAADEEGGVEDTTLDF
ncbi:hypothetical protein B0H10DRAFT_2234035 [Mycena sp. CBHHK59/15]|nr:hypothetical protein B0H10DRAFT_2234035 [Mycena sp. CBHHK59/15]